MYILYLRIIQISFFFIKCGMTYGFKIPLKTRFQLIWSGSYKIKLSIWIWHLLNVNSFHSNSIPSGCMMLQLALSRGIIQVYLVVDHVIINSWRVILATDFPLQYNYEPITYIWLKILDIFHWFILNYGSHCNKVFL